MGKWDDDDWEDEEEVKPKPKPKAKAETKPKAKPKAEPKPAQDDDNWSEEEYPAISAKPKAKGKEPPKSPTKAAASSSKEEKFDPPARGKEAKEAAPEQKVVMKDSLAELELNLQSNVDTLVKMVTPKLNEAAAKRAHNKFLTDVFKDLQIKLTLQEAEQVNRLAKDALAKRKKEVAEAEAKKKIEDEQKEKEKKDAEREAAGELNDEDFFANMM
eukprot:gnl/TRDRNA2_/TRDRNA2_182513_c0_seq1.p1 gnl/TRDRNA2_/TRDRNA2_182513_c0~~gnl/TRDRNA2_/TRDRNA2_182513_c0_seq1.p1  ORF type:complete len:215 (+),score=92.52 gnl/TRDRNA2_/TRDRNA2_182513_c0_seq1:132-776(+)